ncbi:hypothetical protein QR680_013219 [Steinernema hermaphroditum]|uniref:Uncharacterized protein n=1 Tax=Steinernema hermaphroditum TaxID=289476 RepID=A0AA39I4R5_9BILA|nr:hypothetical protein QR680_013219 [Steinernema hermaphroditum]
MKERPSRMKVAILGDANVGKTALLNRFVFDRFEHDYKFTSDSGWLQIWDTAGHERFHSILPAIVRDASAAVLVYDVTDESSFHNVAYWRMFVQLECRNDPFVVIVGTKADDVKKRQVANSSGRRFAAETSFLETSAKTGLNVDSIVASRSVVDCDPRGRISLRLRPEDHSKSKKTICGCS